MSDYSHNASAESPASSNRGSPSPTLVNMPLKEFPPAQPTFHAPIPGVPRLLTPAPNPSVPIREDTAPLTSAKCHSTYTCLARNLCYLQTAASHLQVKFLQGK